MARIFNARGVYEGDVAVGCSVCLVAAGEVRAAATGRWGPSICIVLIRGLVCSEAIWQNKIRNSSRQIMVGGWWKN
jgi:hypothetical protein